MGVCALVAFVALMLEYGFDLRGPEWREWLHLVDLACVLVFAALQTTKLLVVEHPRAYLSTHRIDFTLLFVVAVQAAIHIGLRGTAEYRYLARHGSENLLWAFYIGVIQVYFLLIVVARSHLVHRFLISMRLRPTQMLVTSFALLVLAGTLLLILPGASRNGESIGIVDALFTSTSAVCVTGLTVRDPGTQLSALGWGALLLLMQAGGLGMLTITGSTAVLAGRRFDSREETSIAKAMGIDEAGRMRAITLQIVTTALVIESVGAAILYRLWDDAIPDPLVRGFYSIFHGVSAFCNAGFALFPDGASLTGFSGDAGILVITALLIIAGGIGFGVLAEMGRVVRGLLLRTPRRLSRGARSAILSASSLVVLGAILFHLLEGVDPWGAFFQSVTLRTAGFNSIDLNGLGIAAVSFSIIWMLIGGAPGGTAGGVKTATVTVLFSALSRRTGDTAAVRHALRALGSFVAAYCVSTLLLALIEGTFNRQIAFEAASALGTVGLSMGATAQLGLAGKLLVCVTMFAGRVGPFVLVVSMLSRGDARIDDAPGRALLGG